MKKLIYTAWVTADGYVAGPAGEMDWILGDAQMSEYEIGVVSDADTLMLGRQTYLDFAGYWPATARNTQAPKWEQTYGRKVDALHKVVVSRTLKEARWGEASIIPELTREAVESLKAGSGKNIVMYGSVAVLQQLAGMELVDEFHLLVHPVLVGGGRRLFEHIDNRLELERATVDAFASGVTLTVYRNRL